MEIVNNFQWQVAKSFQLATCQLRALRQPLHQKSGKREHNKWLHLFASFVKC